MQSSEVSPHKTVRIGLREFKTSSFVPLHPMAISADPRPHESDNMDWRKWTQCNAGPCMKRAVQPRNLRNQIVASRAPDIHFLTYCAEINEVGFTKCIFSSRVSGKPVSKWTWANHLMKNAKKAVPEEGVRAWMMNPLVVTLRVQQFSRGV
jgi:hypothetical protein